MAIYELGKERITPVNPTTFAAEGIHERADLQRLLRDHIAILSQGLHVVTEGIERADDELRAVDVFERASGRSVDDLRVDDLASGPAEPGCHFRLPCSESLRD